MALRIMTTQQMTIKQNDDQYNDIEHDDDILQNDVQDKDVQHNGTQHYINNTGSIKNIQHHCSYVECHLLLSVKYLKMLNVKMLNVIPSFLS